MLKKFLIVLALVCVGFAAHATTDIQPNGNLAGGSTAANCTQPVLGTYSGSTNFEAKWRANTVSLRWYSVNSQLSVSDPSNTCTYDSILTLPSAPSRIGYDFNGWKVRQLYDFSSLTTSSDGTERWSICPSVCYHGVGTASATGTACSSSDFQDLQMYEWKVKFSWGTIYGMSKCSNVSASSQGATGNPGSTTGQYCWCLATGYKPDGGSIIYGPSKNLSWVYDTSRSSADNCNTTCTNYCEYHFRSTASLREAMLHQ